MTASAETVVPRPVRLDAAGVSLNGDLSLPSDASPLARLLGQNVQLMARQLEILQQLVLDHVFET